MGYSAKVIADSIAQGVRLTTMEVTFPRFILAEFNTHRMFSRNSASSRAIPVEKRIADIEADPFVPEAFGRNIRGMQAGEKLDPAMQAMSRACWMNGMREAIKAAKGLVEAGVHKQWANRLLEPFAWHTVVVTSTEWENYFGLRISKDAQPEIRTISEMMKAAMDASTPMEMTVGSWHLPYVYEEDRITVMDDDDFYERPLGETLARISSARCARVSYLTHDGRRDLHEDLALADKLQTPGHMSPFEHAAKVGREFDSEDQLTAEAKTAQWKYDDVNKEFFPEFVGNFRWPWVQYRKMLPNEAIFVPKT